MNVALWIVQVLLAVAFTASGAMKILRPKPKLVEMGMGWAQSYPDAGVKAIGVAEVLGAIGLILPWATDIAPVLTPLAAVGLAIIMVGAAITHARLKEYQLLPVNVVLFALSVFVAVGRF
jgi:uncharacterized membrane protein YphA (DoxX/SURF4 family)